MTDNEEKGNKLASIEQIRDLVAQKFARRVIPGTGETEPCKINEAQELDGVFGQLLDNPHLPSDERRKYKALRRQLQEAPADFKIEDIEIQGEFKYGITITDSGDKEFFVRGCTLKRSAFNNAEEYNRTMEALKNGDQEIHDLGLDRLSLGFLRQIKMATQEDGSEKLQWSVVEEDKPITTRLNFKYVPMKRFYDELSEYIGGDKAPSPAHENDTLEHD